MISVVFGLLILVLSYYLINRNNLLSVFNAIYLYLFFIILRLIQYENFRVLDGDNITSIVKILTVLSVLCISLIIGKYLGSRTKIKVIKVSYKNISISILKTIGILFFVVSLVLWISAILSIGTNIYQIIGSPDRYLRHLPVWHIVGMNFSTAAIFVLSYLYFQRKERLYLLLSVIAIYIILALVLTRRSLILPLISIPIFYYIVKNNITISLKKILFSGILLLCFSIIMQSVRYYYGYSLIGNEAGFLFAMEMALNAHLSEVDPLLTIIQKESILTFKMWSYESWVNWIFQIIPSFILEAKPEHNAIGKYIAKYYYGSTDLSHGRPPTIFGTFYLNFGIMGVFVGGVWFSFISSVLDKFMSVLKPSNFIVVGIVYMIWFTLIFYLLRLGDLTSSLNQFLATFLPLIISLMAYTIIMYSHRDKQKIL